MNTYVDYLETENGKIYYESAGTGETIVLLHAAFLDSRMFDPQWEMLTKSFHVIRYDMLGFGKSDVLTQPVCRRNNLEWLLRHLGVKSAHLVGSSVGGSLALDFALQNSDMVRSLTLIGATPSGFELKGEPPRYMMEMFGALQNGNIELANELQVRIWFEGEYRVPQDMDQKLRRRVLEMNRISIENNTMLMEMQPQCPLDPPAVSRLENVHCPVHLIVGENDHSEIKRSNDEMFQKMPNARMSTIENAGHVASLEKPDVVNDYLIGFLLAG